jgi:hypothetical protein
MTKPDPLEEIKKLYYNATKSTIQKDIAPRHRAAEDHPR